MNKFLIALLIAMFSLALPFTNYAANDEASVIKLYMGEVKLVPVSNPSRIAIGNPAVADVTNAAKNEITIAPKAPGKTTLVVWDNFGEQDYQIKVFAEDIIAVKARIDNLLSKINLPDVKTQAEEDEGKVVLSGKVKSTEEKSRLDLVLGGLKDKILDLVQIKEDERAIEIDVQVLELDKDASTQLGFTWPSQINITEMGSPGIPVTGATSVTTGTTPSTSYSVTPGQTTWGKLFRVLDLSRPAFTLTIDALQRDGKARILSRPRLACQSGKEAELLVGGEKPTFTTDVASAGGEGTSVEYKEYGIKLRIKPTVTDDFRIKVLLNVEISEVGLAETIGSTTTVTAKAYPVTKRNISTEVYLNDGQTLSIGGLIKQKEEISNRSVPFLGKLPILGFIFRSKATSTGGGFGERGDTELFITLTPTLINPMPMLQKKEEAQIVAAPTPVVTQAVSSAYELPENIKNYASLVQKRIIENINYPTSAKSAGFQGTVKLGLRLTYLGELTDVTVRSSSGYTALDDDAIATAKKITSYPPFPPTVTEKDIWVDIPISYKLN